MAKDEEGFRLMIEAAAESGMPPEFIYAMHKTRLFITEDNMQRMSEAQIDSWNSAIEEYKRLSSGPAV